MKREQVEARLNYLKLVYSSRQKEIEEWLVVREQIRQEEELRERQKEAARKLQVDIIAYAIFQNYLFGFPEKLLQTLLCYRRGGEE